MNAPQICGAFLHKHAATQRRSDTATFGILNIIGDVLGAIKLYIYYYIL